MIPHRICTNPRFVNATRWRIVVVRTPLLVSGWIARARLVLVLAHGFLEMRIPRLRRERVRSFEIGSASDRRRVYVRANGTDTFTFYEVFVKGVYDRLLPLGPTDVIMDLGANIGMASAYFDFCCPGVRIVAVEPESANSELWRLNVTSPAAVLLEAAVSPHVGEATLAVSGPTSHHLVAHAEQNGCVVRTVTPDWVASLSESPATLIKCDIEGAESGVFSRSWDALGGVRMILMEVHGDGTLPAVEPALYGEGFELQPKARPDLPEVFTRR
jgi:FkbM family methyltransferase